MKIQQHDGVVVDAAAISAELRQASTRGRGRRQEHGCGCPPSPILYIGPLGGAPALGDPISKGGGGQGGNLPPKPGGGAPTPRVSNPRRRGPKGGAPAHLGLVPLPLQPMWPPGAGGPPW